VLLSLLGREGIQIYDTLALPAVDEKKIKPVLNALTTYFQPLKTKVFDRFLFHRRHQQPREPFDAWLVELLSLVKPCNNCSAAVIESIVPEKIVLGVANEQGCEKLLFDTGLTLTKACNIVRACESASSQPTQMAARTDLTVHRLMDSSSKGRPASQPNKVVKMVETGSHRISLIVKAVVDVIKKVNIRQMLSAFHVAKLDISPIDVRIRRLVMVQLKIDRWRHKVHFNMMADSSPSGQHKERRSCNSSCMRLRRRSGTTSVKKAGFWPIL
jgi:hypothetical protein